MFAWSWLKLVKSGWCSKVCSWVLSVDCRLCKRLQGMPDSLIVGNTSVFPGSLKKNKILITQRESGNVACKTLSHWRIKKSVCWGQWELLVSFSEYRSSCQMKSHCEPTRFILFSRGDKAVDGKGEVCTEALRYCSLWTKPGEGCSEEMKQQHDLMKNFQSTDSNREDLHILEIPTCVSRQKIHLAAGRAGSGCRVSSVTVGVGWQSSGAVWAEHPRAFTGNLLKKQMVWFRNPVHLHPWETLTITNWSINKWQLNFLVGISDVLNKKLAHWIACAMHPGHKFQQVHAHRHLLSWRK